jgi:CheY-like chemotaxis protein
MSINCTKTGRILIVEDEPSVRCVFEEVLELEGFIVDMAVDGAEAILKLSNKEYDLFIIDIWMPEINGMELYEYISKQYPELLNRIIFASGDVLGRETRLFLEKVGRPFLLKPFDIGELIAMTREVVSKL